MRYLVPLLYALASHCCAAGIVLELKQDVVVQGPAVVLSQVAAITAPDAHTQQALDTLPLGRAPLAAQAMRRSRAELEALLRRQPEVAGQPLEWRGAQAVQISSASVPLAGQRLVDAAVAHVQAAFGGQYERLELEGDGAVVDVPVPVTGVALRPRALAGQRLQARTAVWIDIVAAGAVQRSVAVPLRVTAWQRVYLARAPMAAGTVIDEAALEARLQQAALGGDAPASRELVVQGGRLKQPVGAGEVLLAGVLAPREAVLRGQRVRLLAGVPGLRVDVPAVAEADAQQGQQVAVRPEHGGGPVMATVVGHGQVKLEE